jgi:hypothetical protein
MTSPENEKDDLQLPWDHQATEILRARQADQARLCSFEEYCDWIEEMKPNRAQVPQIKSFCSIFRLEK